jgi:hypothetical protein
MGILAICPSCGLASSEIRCPRCNTLKVVGCSGSCGACKSDCESDSTASVPTQEHLAGDDAIGKMARSGMSPARRADSADL